MFGVDLPVRVQGTRRHYCVPDQVVYTTPLRRCLHEVSCNQRFCHNFEPSLMTRGIKTLEVQ